MPHFEGMHKELFDYDHIRCILCMQGNYLRSRRVS